MDAEIRSIADGIDHQQDPRYVSLGRLNGAIGTGFLGVASFVGMSALWIASGRLAAGLLLVPLWLALVGLVAWHLQRWPAIAYRHASYRVDDLGIEIRRGVFWRSITSVPRSRVQHTDVSQGPIERKFGLGTLVIHTAGTTHSKVTLDGLEHERARRIRAYLLPAGDSDAV
jgi:membrane protein YdbS with pleckstrin-like domain